VSGHTEPPVLAVIRGDATAEEVAVVLAVLARRRPRTPAAPAPTGADGWRDRRRYLRDTPVTGLQGWRRSAYPL
jgi:hypothetical protein